MGGAAALLASGLLDDRRTVAGQRSGVSAIEAIEKAMEGVTHPDAPEWIAVAQDGDGPNGGFWTCAAATTESPRYIRADIYASLARQAEALQRENAEKDARIAALEAGMRPFSKFAGVVFERNFNSSDPVDTMTATDGAVSTLYARDFFGARALLGGENAGN